MSEEPTETTTTEGETEKPPLYQRVATGDESIATVHADGDALIIVIHGAHSLPLGSTVAVSVRIGDSPNTPPAAAPVKRYLGGPT